MIFIQLSAFILLVMGIVWVLELTPERINKDLSGFFEKRESLQDMSRVARGKKKQNKIVKELSRIRRILTETGKEKNFSVALTLSLILMPQKFFITQDRISGALAGTHPVSEGKFRVYSFFLMNKDNAKRAEFLKDEYGIGGSYGGRVDMAYDSKGLAIGYGNLFVNEKIFLYGRKQISLQSEILPRDA